MALSKPFVSSEAQLFLDSLMPTFMIIQILFNQKHCTLYYFSKGHVWIAIYEFAIYAYVINFPTEHQLLVKVLAYRKYNKRWFKYAPDQPSK